MPRDFVEQDLARLHIGDDRRTGVILEHVFGEQHHELVGPQNTPPPVDHANAVRVPVERNSQFAIMLRDMVLQVHEVRRHGRIRMMPGKRAIDDAVDHMMVSRHARTEHVEDFSPGPVARVPCDPRHAQRRVFLCQDSDVILTNVDILDAAVTLGISGGRGDLAQSLDIIAEEGLAGEGHLEAVIVCRIVAAGHHQPRTGFKVADRE